MHHLAQGYKSSVKERVHMLTGAWVPNPVQVRHIHLGSGRALRMPQPSVCPMPFSGSILRICKYLGNLLGSIRRGGQGHY